MRVVLAEDNVLLREGLARVLTDQGFDVVAQVGTFDALLRAVDERLPDVVVTDVRMPPTHSTEGLRAAGEIKSRYRWIGVLVLSQFPASREAVSLLDGGTPGVGYLLKDRVSTVEELLDAMRRVAEGGSVIDPEVVAALIRQSPPGTIARLSERESQILRLMGEGLSNGSICDVTGLSPKTVETHIRSIFNKLDLPPTPDVHRRVLAVLRQLRSQG